MRILPQLDGQRCWDFPPLWFFSTLSGLASDRYGHRAALHNSFPDKRFDLFAAAICVMASALPLGMATQGAPMPLVA